jgi:transcriptional regulator with XRE-family HTH domain
MRKKRWLSQEKLAEAAELSAQTISDIEGCRTWVSDKTLERLAGVLKVAIYELFMPLNMGYIDKSEVLLYNQLQELRSTINSDIDEKLIRLGSSEEHLDFFRVKPT